MESRRSYSNEERERAVALAKAIGTGKAAYFLGIPYNTVFKWSKVAAPTPSVDRSGCQKTIESANSSVDELVRKIDELKSAVELMTETLLTAAARYETSALYIEASRGDPAPALLLTGEK